MATQAQINANRANAQKSCGPKTEEGKQISSRNRLSHGFTSCFRFLYNEDPSEFYALLDDFIDEYHPATTTEQVLVEKMAHQQWISIRATRLTGDVMTTMHNVAEVFRHLPLMIRYQTAADRAFHKAHAELVKAQKQRTNSQIGFESQKAADKASEPVPEAPKNPAPKPPKIAPQTPVAPKTMNLEEELEWLKSTTAHEIGASGR